MKISANKTNIITVSLGICCIAILLFLGTSSSSPMQGKDSVYSGDPKSAAPYWRKQIARNGVQKTYAEFKERNQQESFEQQHLLGHVFGEVLFEIEGVRGVSVCDSSFGFSCFHGFFGRAISGGGEAAIAELDSSCLSAFGPLGTGCQHGIGHGVLEYVGYADINRALRMCSETTQVVKLLGCTSGVFMEYNSPLAGISGESLPSSRTLSSERPYEPCDTVPDEYRPSCYFELGQWFSGTRTIGLERSKVLCGTLKGDNRKYCFMGVGAAVAFNSQYDVSGALRSCTVSLKSDEAYCRAGLSWGFFSAQKIDESLTVCTFSDTKSTEECLRIADLTEGRDPHREQNRKKQ